MTFDEDNYPSLYDEGESPSELLDSINQKINKQDDIIANQTKMIDQLSMQIALAKQNASSSQKESKKAYRQSVIANAISAISLAIAIVTLIRSL